MSKTILTCMVAAAASTSALGLAIQDDKQSVQAGVYSEEQAERGEKIFSEACMVCHQPEEFSQGAYMEGWAGQTAGDLVDFIRSTMPEDNPGRLKRREYVDVVAFLFKQNGLPMGDAELSRDTLANIVIEGPFGTAGDP